MTVSALTCFADAGERLSAYDLGALGTVEGPPGLAVRKVSPSLAILSSPHDSTVAVFRGLQNEPRSLQAIMQDKAREHNLPVFVRPVHRGLLKELGMSQGLFVHGTQNHSAASESTSKHVRYMMVAGYRKGNEVYLLESWTDHVPEGVLPLNGLQRSWKPNADE
ncbi:hypothetical protein GF324_02065 [bacterium]|nr:hypothetical protein [bacterium]